MTKNQRAFLLVLIVGSTLLLYFLWGRREEMR